MGVLVCAHVFAVCAQDTEINVNRLLMSSHELLVKLDANRADQVWEGVSSALHATAEKQEFQSAIQREQGAAELFGLESGYLYLALPQKKQEMKNQIWMSS